MPSPPFPGPAPKRLLSRLAAFERAERLLSPGDRILAAVSGGADSACLLHHLVRLAPRLRLRIGAIHFHHGLRGKAADRDAETARKLAGRLGVPFELERLPVKRTAETERRSLEDAARKLRYRALAAAARRQGMNKAAAGHQLDDQAETVLLHLLRGTQAKGLAGIPPRRVLKEGAAPRARKVELIRPLLALTRDETRAYCRAYALPWREDRSNLSERFTRNWVRRKVLPLLAKRNPSIRENLAAIAADVRERLQLR